MNLFILHEDPIQAARLYQDLHVNKIIIEGAQMLATAYPLDRLAAIDVPRTQKGNPRKHTHLKHPMTIWVKENINNFEWALEHCIELCNEYTYRFDKVHFTETFIYWCKDNLPDLPNEPQTMHPQCFAVSFPECIVENDPVAGYRNYYNKGKQQFKFGKVWKYASWTRRHVPDFFQPI
jgi:hypothetical protein